MQKPMYPCKVIRITQKHGVGTHLRNFAIDEAGIDGGISNIIAPFTGTIKKIYTADANEVWLESVDKVEYPDGTIDYMTILFAHDNDISNLKVGQIIKQGQVFYQEGTKGQASGNHVHFECGKGKFTGTGWHNDNGSWDINNGKQADQCLWIDDSYTIKNAAGYNFRKVVTYYGNPAARNEYVNQIEILADNVRARDNANGKILGYMKPGIYNSLEFITKDGYDWHRVEDGLWFANGEWSKWLPKKEEPKVPNVDELQNEIEKLNKELKLLNEKNESLLKEFDTLIAAQPKFIFKSTKSDFYAIKLRENQKLYLG